MSSKTKIFVLKFKEMIYTIIFVILGITLLILLILIIAGMIKNKKHTVAERIYSPGIYSSCVVLEQNPVDLEVVIDENQIKSICLVNYSESVETMYPLLSSSLDDISAQVIKNNSTENITYSYDHKYSSTVLINAINCSLKKAQATP